MKQLMHLDITSDPAQLASVRRAIEAFTGACGFDENTIADTGLCVNEALSNITRHAYGGAEDRPIELDARFEDRLLTVTLRDWGNGKDPSETPPKKDPLVPGGLGLVCLRELMDEVSFRPMPDGMLLTLKQRLAPTGT